MERLTFEGNFCDISRCIGEYRMTSECENGACDARKVWERLKEYEDTGLTPDQVAAMKAELQDERYRHDRQADFTVGQSQKIDQLNQQIDRLKDLVAAYTKAEKEGRIVVLPCKVGDTVYYPDYQKGVGVVAARVQGISVSGNDVVLHFGGYPAMSLQGSNIGKTIFLTREEAEKALEEVSKNG